MSLPPDPITAAPAPSAAGAQPGADVTRPAWASTDELMRRYYDTEWGVPVREERALFEALSLEVFQSGLSWSTILRKREAFRAAFAGFQPDRVAAYTEHDVERLLADEGIVRNRLKILATIQNARATVALRGDGGLVQFMWSFAPRSGAAPASEPLTRSPESAALAKALKARGFQFVGPTTMYALMQAVGMLNVRGADAGS